MPTLHPNHPNFYYHSRKLALIVTTMKARPKTPLYRLFYDATVCFTCDGDLIQWVLLICRACPSD